MAFGAGDILHVVNMDDGKWWQVRIDPIIIRAFAQCIGLGNLSLVANLRKEIFCVVTRWIRHVPDETAREFKSRRDPYPVK